MFNHMYSYISLIHFFSPKCGTTLTAWFSSAFDNVSVSFAKIDLVQGSNMKFVADGADIVRGAKM